MTIMPFDLKETTPKTRYTDAQQEAIDAVLAGENIVLGALPGTGKTFTMLEMMRRKPARERKLMVSFMKNNKLDLEARIKAKGIQNCEAKTVNGMGATLMFKNTRSGKSYRPTDKKYFNMAYKELFDKGRVQDVAKRRGLSVWDDYAVGIPVAMGIKKLVDAVQNQAVHYQDMDRIRAIAAGMNMTLHDYEDIFADVISAGYDAALRRYMSWNDQIYVPLMEGWHEQYAGLIDSVSVDELQDMTPAKLRFLFGAVGSNQFTGAGDSNQAVMAFAGAAPSAFHDAVKLFKARVVKFRESWRFGPEIARYGQMVDPDLIGAAPVADEVDHWTFRDYEQLRALVGQNSAVIARWNGTLLFLACELRKLGIPFHFRREGALDKMANLLRKEIAPLMKQGAASLKAALHTYILEQKANPDKQDLWYVKVNIGVAELCLIMEHELETGSPEKLAEEIIAMATERSPDDIVLTAAHSAKGLEWDHVLIVERDHFLKKPRFGGIDQEENVWFVAVTRARQRMIFMDILDEQQQASVQTSAETEDDL